MISVSNKRWSEISILDRKIEKISQDKNYSWILSKLIVSRNFDTDEINSIDDHQKINFSNIFKGNNDFIESISLIYKSIVDKEVICIFGDYDVDGSVATALLSKFFKCIKQPFFFYIPDRVKDGYGPNIKVFKKLIAKKPSLFIMVDCGSTSHDEIEFLNKNNIKSLVIDHHQIDRPYPNATKIINPKKDNGYMKYDYLCASSLTYFFILNLIRYINETKKITGLDKFIIDDYLIHIFLATICDVMPVRKINRQIGLSAFRNFDINKTPFIKEIFNQLDKNDILKTNDLGFLIGPILNSGGRLGKSDYATKLLCSDDQSEISSLVNQLINLNKKRKNFQENILSSIKYDLINKNNNHLIFIYDPTFNEGLIGIIAARLKDHFLRPSFVLTNSKNIIKGSVRSIYGFDVGLAIKKAKDLKIIISGGGHKMAAGFSVNKDKLNIFKKFLNDLFKKETNNLPLNVVTYDFKVSASSFNMQFYDEIIKLMPFGTGNPEPTFLIEDLKIIKPKIVNNQHISNLFIAKNGFSIQSIAFNSTKNDLGKFLLNFKKKVNVIGSINENFWNNKKKLQLITKDLII